MTSSDRPRATVEPPEPVEWPADASSEHRAQLQKLRDALRAIADPLLLAPQPEGSAARDPLEALVSRQVDATLTLKGWWGVYSLQAAKGLRFGDAVVGPDDRLRLVRSERDRYFAAKSYPVLLPPDTRLHLEPADGSLWLGLDLPAETGPLMVGQPGTIDFYLAPNNPQQRVLVDRLLARSWSAMRSVDQPGRETFAVLPAGADSSDPLNDVAPPHRLLRNLLRLPTDLFVGLERFAVADRTLYWLRVPWPEPLDGVALAFLRGMRMNAAVFSNRLPGALNAGLQTRFIPRSRAIEGDQGVLISRVWDVKSAQERYDRRVCAATAFDTYSVRPAPDHQDFVAELVWDGPVSEHLVVEYEYVPMQGIPVGEIKIGDKLEAERQERVGSGELLEVWQSTDPAADDRELWRAFASGLAGRGRAVTRREIVNLLARQDYMGLDKLIDPSSISFNHRIGRVAGHMGVVPYVEISIPLLNEDVLSDRDHDDVARLLEGRLIQSSAIGHRFRIRLVNRRGEA